MGGVIYNDDTTTPNFDGIGATSKCACDTKGDKPIRSLDKKECVATCTKGYFLEVNQK